MSNTPDVRGKIEEEECITTGSTRGKRDTSILTGLESGVNASVRDRLEPVSRLFLNIWYEDCQVRRPWIAQ